MDELFELHHDRLFLRREAREHGYNDRALVAALRDGAIARVRHGAYVDARTWAGADAVERFRIRGRAVLLTHPDVVLSHTSAAAEHRLRLYGADLSSVHVTRLDGNSGTPSRDVVYHHGTLREDDVLLDAGRRLVSPVRAAVETALIHDIETGVCCIDTLLDPRLDIAGLRPVVPEEIYAVARGVALWPGARRLQITVRLARVGSQSVGESRSRIMCWRHHLPEPVLQWEVWDDDGLVGVCDFAWPDRRLLGEFDGKLKYLRPHDPTKSPGDVVFEEKKREDRMRGASRCAMARWTWTDLDPRRQARTAAYIASRMS